MSQRECGYATPGPSSARMSPGVSSHGRSTSPGDAQMLDANISQAATPSLAVTPACSSSPQPTPCSNISDPPAPAAEGVLNMAHMELGIHLITDHRLFTLSDHVGELRHGVEYALRKGLEAPYLLHQLLAFSARHLAFVHPERAGSLKHLADTLQTRAVSLFNMSDWSQRVDRSNCVEILLFSVALGHHLLADMLAKRPGGLEGFVAHCTQCMDTQRGIYTVAKSAWPLLLETDLAPSLNWSKGFTSRRPKGDDCDGVLDLVDRSPSLTEDDKQACRTAINYLQVGLDAIPLDQEATEGNPYQMLFSWTMLVPQEFTRLVADRRPEAIVVLAYYAMLLYHGRFMWQVQDAGAYIMGLIVDYLPPEWHPWLEHPREWISC